MICFGRLFCQVWCVCVCSFSVCSKFRKIRHRTFLWNIENRESVKNFIYSNWENINSNIVVFFTYAWTRIWQNLKRMSNIIIWRTTKISIIEKNFITLCYSFNFFICKTNTIICLIDNITAVLCIEKDFIYDFKESYCRIWWHLF